MSNKQLTLGYEILPPSLAIKSMRSSGYRDTAHAVAELIDNSVQAGLDVNDCTEIEVICVDRVELVEERRRQRVDQIAVYDNACGMDAGILRIALQFGNGTHLDPETQAGIGKFGMGLPNASISQCRRLDVWTWQDSSCLHTYLDIDEVVRGELREVPEPRESSLPDFWSGLIRNPIHAHGTLVVWSQLDRVKWKTSTAFLRNASFLVGRMYRNFLERGSVRIRTAAYENTGGRLDPRIDEDVLPNDPMFLMRGTGCPEPYDRNPAFDLAAEFPLTVGMNGVAHEVLLRFSVATPEVRALGGNSAIGKRAKKNQGVSLVRADRELELSNAFDNTYDPRERWWGVEVHFGPELDDVFGVTNTKQAATAFKEMDAEGDAEAEGMTPEEYRDFLRENQDPRLPMYEISKQIKKNLKTLRDQIERMAKGTRSGGTVPASSSAEDIATRATKHRREKLGDLGESDRDEKLPEEQRTEELAEELIKDGVPDEEARKIAVEYVRRNVKYLFKEADVPGPAMFDVRSKAGTIVVLLNRNHPARDHLFSLLENEEGDRTETRRLQGLELLISAWARLEDEAGQERRQLLEDMRFDWGRMARDFLQEAEA